MRDRLNTLADTPASDMILDLTPVTFLTSGGLGAVLGLRLRLRAAGRELHLAGGDPVSKILRITGFTQVSLHNNVKEALTAAKRQHRWRRWLRRPWIP
ncbi:STAS domain-containing protein [Streptomyces sp. NPDC056500]|uniref:STAS domain-containing protein n=1 Tax=Streptomyces sp. NPDC056500 TaxID=3345840 RepID=UPI003690932C